MAIILLVFTFGINPSEIINNIMDKIEDKREERFERRQQMAKEQKEQKEQKEEVESPAQRRKDKEKKEEHKLSLLKCNKRRKIQWKTKLRLILAEEL